MVKTAMQEGHSENNDFTFTALESNPQPIHSREKSSGPQSHHSRTPSDQHSNSSQSASPVKNIFIGENLKKTEDASMTVTSIISNTPSIVDRGFKDKELQNQEEEEVQEEAKRSVNSVPSLDNLDSEKPIFNPTKASPKKLKNSLHSLSKHIFNSFQQPFAEDLDDFDEHGQQKNSQEDFSDLNSKREKETEFPSSGRFSPAGLYLRSSTTIKKGSKTNSLGLGILQAEDLSIPEPNSNPNVQGQDRRKILDSFEVNKQEEEMEMESPSIRPRKRKSQTYPETKIKITTKAIR